MTQYFVIAQLILLSFNWSLPLEKGEEWTNIALANLESQNGLTTCRCRDSLTLITFYTATDGTNWKETWDLSQPLEEWSGVALNNGDCVSGLTLNGNDLVGEIPTEIGDLSGLKQISMGSNKLSGPLPSSIGNLENLESINFRNNQLSGSIPIEIGKLSKLNTLNLSLNNFSGIIPSEIGNLRALTGLFLNQNNLTGSIPMLLGNLSELISLNFSINNLEGTLPNELGNLLKLTGIGLNGNNFSGPPERFGQLEKLVSFRLENNNLSGSIPESYGNLLHLETIFLFNNNLSGCFPESFENLCALIDNTSQMGRGYNFRNNPQLPWQGDFVNFCDGANQLGATCDDSNPNTIIDGINEDCSCLKMVESTEEPIQISLAIETIGTCPDASVGQASITVFPNDSEYVIDWLPPTGDLNIGMTTNTIFNRDALSSGTHSITVVDVSESLSPIVSSIVIPTLNCFDKTKIPQMITPNGDRLNEQFIFDELENNRKRFPDNELIIFNRWGNVVFTAKPYQNNWAGTNQTGSALPEGTYYYVFKLDLNEGLIIKGDITVVR